MITRTSVGVGGESYERGTWEAALLVVRSKVLQTYALAFAGTNCLQE